MNRVTFWDAQGKSVDGSSGHEYLKSAGLDWNVVGQPLFSYGVGDASHLLLPVPGRKSVIRTDQMRAIATVGEGYKFFQNETLGEAVDALLELHGDAKVVKAGELNGGRVVYMSVELPDEIRIEGDDSPRKKYLVLRTGHDGLTSLTLGIAYIRWTCQNQVNMTFRGLKDKVVIRHTVNAKVSIEEMRKALRFVNPYLESVAAVETELLDRKMTINDLKKITEKLIPSMADDDSKAVKAQAQRDIIIALAQNSANLQNLDWTLFRGFQAVAEYADHERVYRKTKKGPAEDARAMAIMGGTAQKLKDNFLTLTLGGQRRDRSGHFVKV